MQVGEGEDDGEGECDVLGEGDLLYVAVADPETLRTMFKKYNV